MKQTDKIRLDSRGAEEIDLAAGKGPMQDMRDDRTDHVLRGPMSEK